jgi:hypothetical protein
MQSASVRLARWLAVVGLGVLASACAGKPAVVKAAQPYCRYTAVSAVDKSKLPQKIYFFPPLLCDAKGNPKQALQPVQAADGSLKGWSSPSPISAQVEKRLQARAREAGYQPVSFAEVLATTEAHSILIVSSFYSESFPVEAPKAGQPDRFILSMMKASTFDLSLDPSKSRNIGKSDGLSFFSAGSPLEKLEAKSLSSLVETLGDNVEGYINLNL